MWLPSADGAFLGSSHKGKSTGAGLLLLGRLIASPLGIRALLVA